MATKVFELASKMNVVPNVVSYTTLIRGWCEKGCEDRAIEVMERMKAAGVRPNVVTLNALIRSYCKDRNMRAATSLLETMRRAGLRPDVRTCTHSCRLDRVEEYGSCYGFVQADEEKQRSASGYRTYTLLISVGLTTDATN